MPASRTPESQWSTRSPTLPRLCLQNVAYPTDTGRHLCLIAANRTPCRRNQRARFRAIRTACCCLKSLDIRVEARANVTERAVRSRQLQLMQASVQHYPTEDLNTADTSCPSRTRLKTSMTDLVPVQRINARIPVPMWLSQQPWSTDRIEYNWLQRMHLLTAEGAPRLQACIHAVELAIIANSIALDTVLKAAYTTRVHCSSNDDDDWKRATERTLSAPWMP